MPWTTCPTGEQLSAYLLGKLAVAEARQVFEHLQRCPHCEVTLAGLETAPREDTLLSCLQGRAPANPYESEPECQAAVARAEALADKSLPPNRAAAEASQTESTILSELGEYRLLEKLGQGGMGTVYKALHTKLDRTVALKVFPKDRLDDPRRGARFEREMKAVGRPNHPNIVQAYDAREIEGTMVLVMEACGLERIDGWGANSNRTSRLHGMLNNGQRHHLLVSVWPEGDQASVQVYLTGKPYIDWAGKQSSIASSPSWELPQANRPALAAFDSIVTFHKVRLRATAGKAHWLAGAPLPKRSATSEGVIASDGDLGDDILSEPSEQPKPD